MALIITIGIMLVLGSILMIVLTAKSRLLPRDMTIVSIIVSTSGLWLGVYCLVMVYKLS